MKKRIFYLFLLFLYISSVCFPQSDTRNFKSDLIIFHAGSLSVPMKEAVTEFNKLYPEITVFLESAGSVASARKITDLGRSCDILASADYAVIDNMLIPKFADWNIKFATNELSIVYHDQSRYSSLINTGNWYEILMRSDVSFGRADPNSDPCGYRSVLALKLAEKYYGKPGLENRITSKDKNYIRPKEVDLLALLESGAIDYIFLYRSVAVQHQLRYLRLPDEINLRNMSLAELYSTASTEINGKEPGKKEIISGEPMVYGITMLRESPHRKAALLFLEYFLSRDKGMKIMERNGQPSVIPMKTRNYEKIPASLQPYAKPIK